MDNKNDPDSSVSRMLLTLESSPILLRIEKEWLTLAKALKIPQDVEDIIRFDFLCGSTCPKKILSILLLNWRSRNGKNANIATLIKVLEEQCNWLGIGSQIVRNVETNLSFESMKNINWTKLQRHQRCILLSKDVIMLGRKDSLYNITKEIPEHELNKIFEECLHEKTIRRLLESSTFELTRNTIPPAIPYYVDRKLVLRNIVDSSIFSSTINDICAVEGIDRQALHTLSAFQPTDISSRQIRGITCRFIVLEKTVHFPQLRSRIGNPIHHIRFQMDKFVHVRSHGNMESIKKFILKDDSFITEHCLLTKFLSNHNQTTIVFSSAASGDGKSIFLANIARKLEQQYKTRLVLYVEFHHLLQFDFKNKFRDTYENSINKLARLYSKNELGRRILLHKFNNKNVQIELFLDGLDELTTEEAEIATTMITFINDHFSNIRIFTTSSERSHRNLNQINKHILLKLDELTQRELCRVQCLYWNQYKKIHLSERLEKFAMSCLKLLPLSEGSDTCPVVGKPMLASVLAQLYEDVVDVFCLKMDQLISTSNISVSAIYQAYLSRKLDSENRNRHVKLAIDLLFPGDLPTILQETNMCGYENQEREFKTEIVNKNLLNNKNQFVHKTYKEFLLGFHLVNCLTNFDLGEETHVQLIVLMSKVLQTVKVHDEFILNQVSFCDTFNSILLECSILQNKNILVFSKELVEQVKNVRTILIACVNSKLYGLFCLVAYGLPENKTLEHLQIGNLDIVNILDIASKHMGISCVSKIHNKLLHLSKAKVSGMSLGSFQPLNTECTPTHYAAKKGNFRLIEYLLNKDTKIEQPRFLVHAIVYNSKSDLVATIEGKIQIVKYLIQTKSKPNMLEESSDNLSKPILQQNIHVKLLKSLIEVGANVFAKDRNGNSLAHIMSTYLSPDEYHNLVEMLVNHDAGAIFREHNNNNQTALEYALTNLKVRADTLALLISSKAINFNRTEYNTKGFNVDMNILYKFIEYEYDSDVIHAALQSLSESFNSKAGNEYLLNAASYWQNINVMKYLLRLGTDVNSRNEHGMTPLHVICSNKSIYCRKDNKSPEVLALLLQQGANISLLDYSAHDAISLLLHS